MSNTPQPLVYPEIAGQGQYTNVLLIDSQVIDYQIIVDAVNSSTFPIVYSSLSQKSDLLALLQSHFTNISRLALLFTFGNTKKFLDNQPLFQKNEAQPYSENVQFILDLITQFQIKNIDYLACDTLNYVNWTAYYSILMQNTSVIVGASNNQTGNLQFGGDWVLESTSQDVEALYFTSSIEYYQYLLDDLNWATSAQGLSLPYYSVIDNTNTYMYVTNNGNGTVSRISLSNPKTNYVREFLTGFDTNILGGITIDSSSQYLYISEYYLVNHVVDPAIYQVNISTKVKTLLTNSIQIEFTGSIQIDRTNNYLYLLTAGGGSVAQLNITTRSVNLNFAVFPEITNGSLSLFLDKENNFLYVSNSILNKIVKLTLSNASPPTVLSYDGNWASVPYPFGMTIDSTNSYMYVVSNNVADVSNSIIQLSINNRSNYITYASYTKGIDYYPVGITRDSLNQNLYVVNAYTQTIRQISLPPPTPPCFLAGTRILTDEGYIQIQHLRTGDRIQTLCHGFVPIDIIGFKTITHSAEKERVKQQLYKYSTAKTPDLIEDLVLTGCHSVLVDEFTSPEQREKTRDILGDVYITDDKYRLPACLDENAEVFESPGEYTIYHFSLENDDYYMNYGVFANGLLVESSSKRYMKELSEMTLIP
jgi:DNA-binding beta-propeller fold protein YncE